MLHGHFVRQTKEVRNQDRWQWLQNGNLKRETESLIFAAQEQAIRTNVIEGKINKSQEQIKCRMCRLDRKAYLLGNLWSEWNPCIKMESKWYEHQPEAVIELNSCKILWDFTVQADHFITVR